MQVFRTLNMRLGLRCVHNQFLNASLRVDEIKVNLRVLKLETICHFGSHGSSGEWWNADVEQVVTDALATGGAYRISDALTINGHPGYLYNFSSAGTRVTVYSVTPSLVGSPLSILCKLWRSGHHSIHTFTTGYHTIPALLGRKSDGVLHYVINQLYILQECWGIMCLPGIWLRDCTCFFFGVAGKVQPLGRMPEP